MNQRVAEKGAWVVHQYGCCGTFFFFVADAKTRGIRKRTLASLDAALDWIAEQDAAAAVAAENQNLSHDQENVILP